MTRGSEGRPNQLSQAQPQKPPVVVLPAFLELSFTIAKILVVIVGIVIVVVSVLAGVSAWTVALRGAIAILSLGFVLWLINWYFAHNILEKELEDLEKSMKEETGFSTVERHA